MPSMSCSSSAATASRPVWSSESEAPWTSRLLAFSIESVMSIIACSVASCQPIASSTLRWCCWLALRLWRSAIACAVANGSSDGRVISLPEADFICVLVSFAEMLLRSARTLRWTIEVVMRIAIRDPPFRSG